MATLSYKPVVPFAIRDPQALRVTNALQSKTRSLPNETLSYIFRFACQAALDIPSDDNRSLHKSTTRGTRSKPFHLVLRLVSVQWYNVVLSTPQLWTSLTFPSFSTFGWQRGRGQEKLQYIRLCLERSHQFPLSLRVAFLSYYPYTPSNVEDFLKDHAHRVQKLQLSVPPPSWCDLEIPKMPQLTELHFYRGVGLPKFTSVQRLYLVKTDLCCIHTYQPMASITCLNLQHIAVDNSIQLLLKCPNLAEFICHDHAAALTHTVLTSTTLCDHLSTFSWSIPNGNDLPLHDELFEHIRLPSLKYLCLANPHTQKFEPGSPTFTFISRLPASIQELQLRKMDHEVTKGFLEFIDPKANIDTIRVEQCSPLFLRDIFSSLQRPTDEGNMRFPGLSSIHVGIPAGFKRLEHRTPPPLRLWIAQQLLLLLQDRIGTVKWFTFSSEISDLTIWNEKIWGQFRELKDAGLDLIIIEAGKAVDIECRYTELMEEINASLAEKRTMIDAKDMRLRSRTIEKS